MKGKAWYLKLTWHGLVVCDEHDEEMSGPTSALMFINCLVCYVIGSLIPIYSLAYSVFGMDMFSHTIFFDLAKVIIFPFAYLLPQVIIYLFYVAYNWARYKIASWKL